MSESDLAEAALKVERGANAELARADFHSLSIGAPNQGRSRSLHNQRVKPVCPGGGMADAEDLKTNSAALQAKDLSLKQGS